MLNNNNNNNHNASSAFSLQQPLDWNPFDPNPYQFGVGRGAVVVPSDTTSVVNDGGLFVSLHQQQQPFLHASEASSQFYFTLADDEEDYEGGEGHGDVFSLPEQSPSLLSPRH